jgi:hypothetical protein
MRSARGRNRQPTTGEVRLDAANPERFSAPARSMGWFVHPTRDFLLPKMARRVDPQSTAARNLGNVGLSNSALNAPPKVRMLATGSNSRQKTTRRPVAEVSSLIPACAETVITCR